MTKIKQIFLTFFCLYISLNIQLFASNSNNCSIADVVAKLSPSVVNISTTQLIENDSKDNIYPEIPEEFFKFFDIPEEFKKTPFSNKPYKIKSLGSGFLIDEKGHIVTNYHVINNAQEINVTFGDNERKIYKAKVIGKDQITDLALLKIEVSGSIPFVKFGDSDKARVGESVIAIGNAFGLGGTVTSGIISAKGRNLGEQFYEDFLQTDASINKGNSGGPMFNMDGEVIGVNNVILSTSPNGGNIGVGFAIPSNIAKPIISKLIKDGKVERPFLGITFQPMTDEIAKSLNLQHSNGTIVTNVIKDTPADRAGIKIGDIITKFNNAPLNKQNNLRKLVSDSPVGINIPVEVIRKGKNIGLNVKLEIPKKDPFEDEKAERIISAAYQGISVVNLTSDIKNQYKIKNDVTGVFVTKVDKNSDAYKKELQAGDVIMSINYDAVTSVKQFRTLLTNIMLNAKKGEATAALFISRNNTNFYITINLN